MLRSLAFRPRPICPGSRMCAGRTARSRRHVPGPRRDPQHEGGPRAARGEDAHGCASRRGAASVPAGWSVNGECDVPPAHRRGMVCSGRTTPLRCGTHRRNLPTSTLPLANKVAVEAATHRSVVANLPVEDQVPVARWCSSAPGIPSGSVGSSTSDTSTVPSRSECGREAAAAVGLDHVPGGGPGPALRVIQLGGGKVGYLAIG